MTARDDYPNLAASTRTFDKEIPAALQEIDRLHALLATTQERANIALGLLQSFEDALPPCPTCGGKGYHVHCNGCGATWADRDDDYSCSCVCAIGDRNHEAWVQCLCPAKCVDGKVSIEQLVATYNAVHGTNLELATQDHRNAYEYLRSVKPT